MFMKKSNYLTILGILVLSLLVVYSANAHSLSARLRAGSTWSYTFGGTNNDYGKFLMPTNDGGYIVAGTVRSYRSGEYDYWIIKLDSNAQILWQKTFGGYNHEYLNWIEQTSDGGYIITGCLASYGNGGYYDVWVLKLNPLGDLEWQKFYDTSMTDYPWEIHQLNDGGYILSAKYGVTDCLDCKVMVLRLDASGNIIWHKIMGNAPWNDTIAITPTNDGGFAVTGNVKNVGAGGFDFWVAKLNSAGEIIWQKAYGATSDDLIFSILQTSDGGYLLGGQTRSFGNGESDAIILKVDAYGTIQWQKTYGGELPESCMDYRKSQLSLT